MTERPILFSAPMVRALLAGTKTQTRRIMKPQPTESYSVLGAVRESRGWSWPMRDGQCLPCPGDAIQALCPHGAPGDLLWVREAWKYADWTEDGDPWIAYAAGGEDILCRTFEAEWPDRLGDIWASLSEPANYAIDGRAADRRWRPSIHMPRWASRITLEITEVRVQRLQEISEEDARAEGVQMPDGTPTPPDWWSYRQEFSHLWESINGPGSWDANPWLWCISFRRTDAS